ncbi:aromatic amino acid lyase [Actinoplanes sp. LDG1-01]|uniref:Aromatic amino acid lyase n=1 Tax=Paractinoplanes lichenicola TaxID=2802976 RepID=A0ABS1W2X4_9ACTN|nr:aromatic amino acid lyase [Actinoplanes lichenicola]
MHASHDPLHAALADSDELRAVLDKIRNLRAKINDPRSQASAPRNLSEPRSQATDAHNLSEPHSQVSDAHNLSEPRSQATDAHNLSEPHSQVSDPPDLSEPPSRTSSPREFASEPHGEVSEPRTVLSESRANIVGALQAPVSFRVTAPALAVALRAVDGLEAAVDRALEAVTDSPAHLEGEFVGTFGFAGTDLVAAVSALTTALVHLAELGTARLHRLLDANLTGLNRQLSESPGLHAGMATVHKRAVGVTHRLRRFAVPALSGAIETSLGQEDVQSFGFEAAECLDEVITGLREVLACELLAVVQAGRLGGPVTLPEFDALLPPGTADRPWGRDIDTIVGRLAER